MKGRRCPVCEHARLKCFLQRSQVPVHQNLLMSTEKAARTVTRGNLDFVVCEACGFVFNQAFDLSRLSYGLNYDATQSYSAVFDAHLDNLVQDLVERRGVKNCTIVEIGYGKGHFLKKLVNYPGVNNIGFGFDPSYAGPLVDLNGRLQFRTCYYDQSCADVAADVVVCRHVIEHVPEPLELLRSVRAALVSSPKARVFFETPCVEWILAHRVIWDFFYEHCSLFTADSLAIAFRRAGFNVERVKHVFGGQYLWLEASLADIDSSWETIGGRDIVKLAMDFAAHEDSLRKALLRQLHDMVRNGKTAIWGGGAKGVTLANLIDPGGVLIDCVVDLNPHKQGRFIPGTGHPIIAPSDLPYRGVRYAVLMNPNYREEIQRLLSEHRIGVELIEFIV